MSDKRVEKIQYDLVSPFGPSIMVGDVPDSIYEEFKGIVNQVIKEKGRTHTIQLSGRLDEEWSVGKDVIFGTRTEEFLEVLINRYCTSLIARIFDKDKYNNDQNDLDSIVNSPVKVTQVGGWVNNMKKYEYNPIHYHPYCNITTVFFFNNLDENFLTDIIANKNIKRNHGAPDSKPGNTDDGILELVYNSANYFEQGTFRIAAKEKMFLVFPAHLLHTVYPFISDENRITVSFNFVTESDIQLVNYGNR